VSPRCRPAITLPLVFPLLLIATMFRAIEAFRLFDLVYILTGGGPGGTTETLPYDVYKVAFFGFDTAGAAAHGILMVIVVILSSHALPPPTADALMATHIQTEELADAGSWARPRHRPRSAVPAASAPASSGTPSAVARSRGRAPRAAARRRTACRACA
jgi:hypothetical protein